MAGGAGEAVAPRREKRDASAMSGFEGSITVHPCPLCGASLAKVLRHQELSASGSEMSPEDFMEAHIQLCFLHGDWVPRSEASGSSSDQETAGAGFVGHQGEPGDSVPHSGTGGQRGGEEDAEDASTGLEEKWQVLAEYLAKRNGEKSAEEGEEEAMPGQLPEGWTLRDYLNAPITPIAEFQERLRAAQSEEERFSIQESIVKSLHDMQQEFLAIDDVVKCLEAEAETAEPGTSGGDRKRRKVQARNPLEPEDSVIFEDKKEADLYGFTYNPSPSHYGNQVPRKRRVGRPATRGRGQSGPPIPDELPLYPGYEYIPPGGNPQPKATRSRKQAIERTAGETAAGPSGARSVPPPNRAPRTQRAARRGPKNPVPPPTSADKSGQALANPNSTQTQDLEKAEEEASVDVPGARSAPNRIPKSQRAMRKGSKNAAPAPAPVPPPTAKSGKALAAPPSTQGPSSSQSLVESAVLSKAYASEPVEKTLPRELFSARFSGAHLEMFREVVSQEPNSAPVLGATRSSHQGTPIARRLRSKPTKSALRNVTQSTKVPAGSAGISSKQASEPKTLNEIAKKAAVGEHDLHQGAIQASHGASAYFDSTPLPMPSVLSPAIPVPTALADPDPAQPKPRARGRTYKTPYSVTGTETPKVTREEEFRAAQNADLGKRRRIKPASAYEAAPPPPPKKRKRAADADLKGGDGNSGDSGEAGAGEPEGGNPAGDKSNKRRR